MENKNLQQKKFFAGGFLFNPKTNQVLLHKRDGRAAVNPNQWGFFGGLCEDGETPKECLLREWKEELDISPKAEDITSLCNYLNKERGTWRYVFYMKSDLKKSDMTLGEGEDFDWIPLDKVFSYDVTEKTKKDLEMFLNVQRDKVL